MLGCDLQEPGDVARGGGGLGQTVALGTDTVLVGVDGHDAEGTILPRHAAQRWAVLLRWMRIVKYNIQTQ